MVSFVVSCDIVPKKVDMTRNASVCVCVAKMHSQSIAKPMKKDREKERER